VSCTCVSPNPWINVHPEHAVLHGDLFAARNGHGTGPHHHPSYASRNRLCIAGNGIDAAIFRAEHPTMPFPLILQPDMMAGECHPITFSSNSQYLTVDSRWLT